MKSKSERFLVSLRSVKNYVMVAPAAIIIGIFLVVPLLFVVLMSFYTSSSFGYQPILTLNNYIKLFSSLTNFRVFTTTFELSAIMIALTLVAAYPISYLLAYKVRSPRIQSLVLLMLLLPFLMDYSIRSLSWFPILGPSGIVNQMLIATHVESQPTNLLFSTNALIVIWLQTYLLFMITPIYLSLVKIDPSLVPAARSLGASPTQAFWNVTFRLSLPGVIVGVIYVLVGTISDFATPEFLGGGLQTIGLTIFQNQSAFVWPAAGALSVVLMGIIVILAILIIRFVNIKEFF